jgi:hypothetical protein
VAVSGVGISRTRALVEENLSDHGELAIERVDEVENGIDKVWE